jgi:hypothetical protein
MSGLRPQRTLFPNSGLGKPLSENVCFVVKTVSRSTVRKVRFENKASATALVSNNRLSEILRTYLIKAVLFQIGVYPICYSRTKFVLVAKRTFRRR